MAPSLNNSAVAWLEVGGEEMTIQRAIEILELNEYKIVEIGCGIFVMTCNEGETEVAGEQQIIDWARELEEME